ncbi:unnamed protein product [Musa acuminata var. zebrina]
MEAGTRLLSPSPPPKQARTYIRNPSFASVARLHDQAVRTIRSVPAASVVRPVSALTLSKDQQDDRRASFNKDENRATATLFKQLTDVGSSDNKEKEEYDFDRHQRGSEDQLLCSGLLDPFPSFHCKEKSLLAMSIEQEDSAKSIGQDKRMQSANGTNFMTPVDVLALATRAAMASREATSLAEKSNILAAQFLESHSSRLEEVQQRLQVQLNHEPTLAEWAQSVGISCDVLRSLISSGRRSRDKMIYANFRLVVHLARQYEGKGLEFQDLLQEGSRGLMKSLEKFKPNAGCRFPTYSYWWIRQSIRKAIFQNSRIIRLPDNIYAFLKEIKYARRLCIQEGRLPTNEEIAKRVGITVKKLEKLLLYFRDPVSIQEHAWQNVTFQEITADPGVEIPDLIVAKQLMRQHVRDILKTLKPKERKIIQYRFGMHENKKKTLSEIGDIYGLSNERIRQLESRALNKLKEWCLTTQGLKAYRDLLV